MPSKHINPTNKSTFKLVKSIVIGLAIPTISMWLWYTISQTTNPFHEYLLITKGITTNGFITKAKEHEDVVEEFDGRKAGLAYDYSYEYYFKIPNGNIITSYGKESGELPENLSSDLPFPVKIEYLASDPQINRVKDMQNNKTIYQWIRYRVLFGIIILLFSVYFGYLFLKIGIKEYNTELLNLNK